MIRISRIALGLLAAAALSGAPAAQAQDTALVTVIHGIFGGDLGAEPPLPVDVHVEGLGCVLRDFRFGDVSPRLDVPEGSYDIEVRLSDGDCGGPVAVSAPDVPFAAGENATVIAHLDANGAPTASKFTNDVSQSPEGQGRASLAHTAAAPAVDIAVYGVFPWRGRQLLLEGVVNGQDAAADLERGYYAVTIAPAGERPIFWELFYVEKAENLQLYAVGTAGKHSFQLLRDRQEQERPEGGDEDALVTVIHGITGEDVGGSPELPVDVHVEGLGCVLRDFQFGEVSPRLDVPPGSYDIEVRLSDGDCGGPVAVSAPDVPFEAGENATVIAHLSAEGAPTASKFVNDVSGARLFEGRLSLHHTAAAPAVDIDVFRRFFIFFRKVLGLEGVTNGLSADEDLVGGRYTVTIAPAGGHPIFDQKIRIRREELLSVYAVGSVAGGTFQLITDHQALDH